MAKLAGGPRRRIDLPRPPRSLKTSEVLQHSPTRGATVEVGESCQARPGRVMAQSNRLDSAPIAGSEPTRA